MANSDSSVIASSVPGAGSRVSTAAVSGRSMAWAKSKRGPSNIQNVTNMPTPTDATSLTVDSVPIATNDTPREQHSGKDRQCHCHVERAAAQQPLDSAASGSDMNENRGQ